MLVLKAVSLGPLHGYGALLRIEQISGEVLQIEQGSLYPALHRLERQGFLVSHWGMSENGRRARFYRLTRAGEKRFVEDRRVWNRLNRAISSALASPAES